jgi:hypothetical protein
VKKKALLWVFAITSIAFLAVLYIAFMSISKDNQEASLSIESTREGNNVCGGEVVRLTENDLEFFDSMTLVVYGFYAETFTDEHGNLQEQDTVGLSVWSRYESDQGYVDILGVGDSSEHYDYRFTLLEIGQQPEYPEPNGYAVVCIDVGSDNTTASITPTP